MRYLIILLGLLLVEFAKAQQTEQWSLSQCIAYAREHALPIKQAKVGVQQARVNKQVAIESRMPSFNLATNYGIRFGRTIDPTTNAFETATLNTNGISLNSGMILYNGGRLNSLVRQGELDVQSSLLDVEQAINDLSLEISSLYLTAALSKEALRLAENNLAFSREQLAAMESLVKNEARAEGDLYEMQSQVAINEQAVVSARNAVGINLLNLAQVMTLSDDLSIDVAVENMEPDESILAYSAGAILQHALSAQPQIRASLIRQQSALEGQKIAKSAYYPTLTIFGNLNTNYSSLSRKVDGFENKLSPPAPVFINGELSTIEFFQVSPILINNPYFNQINENLGVGVGVQLSVPIYDQGRIRADVNRARLQSQLAEVADQQVRQQLKNAVERSLADALAAKSTYESALKTLAFNDRAFQDAQRRYDHGTISLFEYNTVRNRLQSAEIDWLRSKYEYIFRLEVVKFYAGKTDF